MEQIKLIQLPLPELQEVFQEELKKFFESNTVKVKQDQPKTRIVDLEGLLKERPIVGKSKSTIYKKVMDGKIPYSKRGKRLYFDLDLIDEWLLSNSMKTTTELGAEKMTKLINRRKKSS